MGSGSAEYLIGNVELLSEQSSSLWHTRSGASIMKISHSWTVIFGKLATANITTFQSYRLTSHIVGNYWLIHGLPAHIYDAWSNKTVWWRILRSIVCLKILVYLKVWFLHSNLWMSAAHDVWSLDLTKWDVVVLKHVFWHFALGMWASKCYYMLIAYLHCCLIVNYILYFLTRPVTIKLLDIGINMQIIIYLVQKTFKITQKL